MIGRRSTDLVVAFAFAIILAGFFSMPALAQETEAVPDSIVCDTLVTVIPHDGRPIQHLPVYNKEPGCFVPLVSLARALGVRYAWDPYTYRGWIETDSLHTRFTLKSPVLTHGDEGMQLEYGVDYDGRGVLFPIDYFALLNEMWNGGRSTEWRPESSTFVWGTPTSSYSQIDLSHRGHQSTMRIRGATPPRSTLLWSPLGGLQVLLEGWNASAESLAVNSVRGLLNVRDVRGTPKGSRIMVDVAHRTRGAASGYNSRQQMWELLATTSSDESKQGRFIPLEQTMSSGETRQGPVVLACWIDPLIDPVEGRSELRDLAQRTAEFLSSSLGKEAVIIEGRNEVSLAGRANNYHASCVIGFRLDRYSNSTGQLQIWTASPRFHWEILRQREGNEPRPSRPTLWSEVPALSEVRSERLATTLAYHLGKLLGDGMVLTGERPSRWLEGLTMPAVVIHPTIENNPVSLRALKRPERRARLARAIAIGISESLESGRGGSR